MNPSTSFAALALALGMTLLAACGDDSTATSGGAGGGGGAGGNGGGAPLGGECSADADCASGLNVACVDTGDGQCGPVVRKCTSIPATCGENPLHTVCGCDGKTHAAGSCGSATPAGVDTRPGACPPAAGTFSCGEAACTTGTQYCVEGTQSIDCLDLPPSCAAPNADCACLMTAGMSACGCVDEPGGGIRINGCSL